MRQDLFPLPKLEGFFGAVRKEILNGKGFILFKGVPVEEWGLAEKCCKFVPCLPDHIKNEFLLTHLPSIDSLHGLGLVLRILRLPERPRSCLGARKGSR